VTAIGKISDLYSGVGVTTKIKANELDGLMAATMHALCESAGAGVPQLIMTNLVDFDQEYGHRRDVAGYARELEAFDRCIPDVLALLGPEDLLVITADHGCDPTWEGTDHTREQIPVLCWSPALSSRNVGVRQGFADVGQSVTHWLGADALPFGTSIF